MAAAAAVDAVAAANEVTVAIAVDICRLRNEVLRIIH